MRNTSFMDSKIGEALSSIGNKITKTMERATQRGRNFRIQQSGAKGGMGSKGRAKAGASNPATQNFKVGK